MLLAGDIGGTKTLLGLFSAAPERPTPVEIGEFITLDYDGLEPMIREFLRARLVEPRRIEAACFGVAGAVTEQVARLTNVPWRVEGAALAEAFAFRRTRVLNDLEALAYGVTVLQPGEIAVLQRGVPVPGGNAAVIAAGTGLGEALLHNVEGRFVPGASEGGHADFSARTPRELEMVRELTRIFGRVSVEHVISGPGLVNVYQFTHQSFGTGPALTPSSVAPARLCEAVGPVEDPQDLPARISLAAMEQRCPHCVEALDLFVSAYGAEAGNIALRTVATAGVYVGGGIAPKILPALQEGAFLEAFRAKEPMADLVATIPVTVILNSDTGLLGAAVHAQDISTSD
ncbi:MAG: glucokinase [Acidobacteria bacterium RIFCSPLOWO2_02_FULL_67_36]|nr:MAG: glucokinase [Acidobacteria bacterium RIFCSPLOWO2_02_FULL_67_36]OFW20300.1 MAG: glucokinase [Acidobacteria bacterium RIFCSPLOWO2_12_FULL_66_21]